MPKKKNKFRINIEYIGAKSAIIFFDLLPLRFAYFLSNIIAGIGYFLDSKHRNRIIQHLMHAGMVNNKKEAKALAWKNFMYLGRMGIDIFKVNKKITPDNLDQYVKIIMPENAKKVFLSKENPIILLTLHMGNFLSIATVYHIMTGKNFMSVIRPYDNPKIEKMILKDIQCREGHRSCYQKGALKALLSALRKDSTIGMLVDQHVGKSAGIDTTFFGQPCRTHTTPAVFHLKTGCPICPVVLRQAKEPGHFELVMHDPIIVKPSDDRDADIKKITQMYTNSYEELIRETPEQWFWAHRRWTNINRKKR